MRTKIEAKRGKSTVKFSKRLEMVNRHAAGVDVGSTEMWVCAPAGDGAVEIKLFGAFTQDIMAISKWLREHGVTTVAMESTGVYWVPLFQRLERDGFEVFLVNARFVKNVAGRPKTDIHDCQWIQRLHSYGLLPRSFRPDDAVCRLRSVVRHRGNLVREAATQAQRMQKVLHEMNLQLDKAISDITGVTGLRILEAVLSGERDPMALAELADPRIAADKPTVAAALEGDYRDECLFILRQCLDAYYAFRGQIDQCDQWLDGCLKTMAREAAKAAEKADGAASAPAARRPPGQAREAGAPRSRPGRRSLDLADSRGGLDADRRARAGHRAGDRVGDRLRHGQMAHMPPLRLLARPVPQPGDQQQQSQIEQEQEDPEPGGQGIPPGGAVPGPLAILPGSILPEDARPDRAGQGEHRRRQEAGRRLPHHACHRAPLRGSGHGAFRGPPPGRAAQKPAPKGGGNGLRARGEENRLSRGTPGEQGSGTQGQRMWMAGWKRPW